MAIGYFEPHGRPDTAALVLVMISVLSDRYGMRLYNAEGHSDCLLPNLVESARMIVIMFVMIALMLIGGGTGSTAGGIKQIRVCMMLKSMFCSLRSKITCKRIVHTDTICRLDSDETLTPENRVETLDFIMTYLGVFAVGTFILCMCGYPIGQSMFEFSSSLGTVGLSAGITAYDARPVILWTETAGMFIGRLEIYVVLIAIAQLYESARAGIKEKRRRWNER